MMTIRRFMCTTVRLCMTSAVANGALLKCARISQFVKCLDSGLKELQKDSSKLINKNDSRRQTVVRYISDIHLEFLNANQCKLLMNNIQSNAFDQNITEILVLAGDIGNPSLPSYELFLADMNSKFKKIYLLAGNHEYYGLVNRIETVNENIANLCRKYTSIVFLNNKVEYYNNIYFVGTTLWGDLSRCDTNKYQINDVHAIKGMTPQLFSSLYEENAQFLSNALDMIDAAKQPSDKVVAITHHLPTYEVTADQYRIPAYAPYAGWFTGSLDKLLHRHDKNLAYWIYGHTHARDVRRLKWSAVDSVTGATTDVESNCLYVCNPMGYPREKTEGEPFSFDTHIVI